MLCGYLFSGCCRLCGYLFSGCCRLCGSLCQVVVGYAGLCVRLL